MELFGGNRCDGVESGVFGSTLLSCHNEPIGERTKPSTLFNVDPESALGLHSKALSMIRSIHSMTSPTRLTIIEKWINLCIIRLELIKAEPLLIDDIRKRYDFARNLWEEYELY